MEEDNLVQKAMLGDEAALDELVNRYYNVIYAFCCRRMENTTLGADLCQDTFVKMVEHLPAYRERGRFKSWLFTIAANTCRDAFRKMRPVAELTDTLPDNAPATETLTENAQILKDALAALPQKQQEAVILRYYSGFTAKEVARIQRVPLATAKTRLSRGLKKLREVLGEEILLEN